MKIYIFLILSCWGVQSIMHAQTVKPEVLDAAGYVQKYDTSFRGIGPEVYVLPAPRTQEEVLQDGYATIELFREDIDRKILYLRIIKNFKPVSQEMFLDSSVYNRLSQAALDHTVDSLLLSGKGTLAYSLLNTKAKVQLDQNEIGLALENLYRALAIAAETNLREDKANIQSNIALLLLYQGNCLEAGKYQEAYHAFATEDNNRVKIGQSFVSLALIEAFDNDFKSAENTIIRKAIPLFNRGKYPKGKVYAWLQLASIYQMQDRHPEAQWFLIQARDLAKTNKMTEEYAELEYMLGLSKFVQKNFVFSKKELSSAYVFAKEEDNKVLQLAILEKLGKINLIQNNLKDAREQLKAYWKIREEIGYKL